MSDVATLDSQREKPSSVGATNGDNSIPRGEEARIITAVAEHMAAIMRELNLDLEDPNFAETPERVAWAAAAIVSLFIPPST